MLSCKYFIHILKTNSLFCNFMYLSLMKRNINFTFRKSDIIYIKPGLVNSGTSQGSRTYIC